MKNLKFKIDRGGDFNNQGHVTFLGFENIQEGFPLDQMIYDEDEEIWYEVNGDELDYDINLYGTGYVNSGSDTIQVVTENDLNDKQVKSLELELAFNWQTEEIIRIVKNYKQ